MDIILTILGLIVPAKFQLSHLKCMESLLRALLLVLSPNLMKLSRVVAGNAQPASTMRRIQRLLGMRLFSCTSVGIAIVRTLPVKLSKFILTMDRTTWELGKRAYNILAVGICFDGISIPIYFTTFDKDGATSFTEHIEFMERVVDIIPANKIECVVADREFGNGNFIKWLTFMNIPYCLRLRGNIYVRKSGEMHARKLDKILASLPTGRSVVLANSYIVRKNNKVRIYALRRTVRDGEESLMILATPVDSDFTDKIYRLRWQIEVSFRAMKTAGFNLEETHLPLDGHFQNMLKLILVAFACAFIDGLIKIKERPIPTMKSNGRKRFSIFSFGLDIVVGDLWANVKSKPCLAT